VHHVKRSIVVLLVCFGALVGSAAVALAHSTPYSWTVAKARVMLQEGTTIALPADQRAALDTELEAQLRKFNGLLLAARDDPDQWRLAGTYKNYIDRFLRAQNNVNAGLSIDSVRCTGLGKALKGKRYKHFRCNATSYALEIPIIELQAADAILPSLLPEVAEGPRRVIGPLEAVFSVHVRGKSRMLVQRTS
jgi:hypothetical protein